MIFKDLPIRKKLMRVILITSAVVLVLTCSAFFAYEFFTFRQSTLSQLSTLGEIVSANSTAALAFDDRESGAEILAALKAEKHIVTAALFDNRGQLFASYPVHVKAGFINQLPETAGYQFENGYLSGYQEIIQGNKKLGVLYLQSDLEAIYERFQLYGAITLLVIFVSFLMAYLLSETFQRGISAPVLSLADTAKVVSIEKDYSVRAIKLSNDEVGQLTEAFNQMLIQIQEQTGEIKAFNQNLEHKIIERTNQLELANKELEAFSYSISHDLRAPLRAIQGYMGIFLEDYADQFDEEAKRLTKIVIANSKKMGELIDALLAFSKLGRKELKKSEVAMNEIVADICQELKTAEGQRNIELVLHHLPPAHADKIILSQVWANLISNALKYTRGKENARIEIGATEKQEAICYYVKDNGAGFDMKFYNKLFGVFQRLHSHEEFEGTGVGLAIVQRIVSRHEGRLWAEAEVDKGATFYFTLPKNKA